MAAAPVPSPESSGLDAFEHLWAWGVALGGAISGTIGGFLLALRRRNDGDKPEPRHPDVCPAESVDLSKMQAVQDQHTDQIRELRIDLQSIAASLKALATRDDVLDTRADIRELRAVVMSVRLPHGD